MHNTDLGLENLQQEAVWVTPMGMELPWAGMDKEACAFINAPCDGAAGRKDVALNYGLKILEMYPTVREVEASHVTTIRQIINLIPQGYFNIKWKVFTNSENQSRAVACFRFAIKIV